MIYKNFKGKKLSALGLGAMRLPVVDGNDSVINVDAVKEMVAYAMEHGINYYDTAWGYHGGNSELVMGEVLKEYPRDSFYLATKFPGFNLENMEKVEEIFERQLEKCQTTYFDFYLFHNVCEANIDGYLDEKYGIFEYLMKQKENGRIKHLGFSTHGSLETMERFLKAYGKGLEFCQIQLNWLDYHFQNAKQKIELLNKYQLPVWVMEPVRGGKLAKITKEQAAVLKQYRDETAVEWAFHFLQAIPEVTVTLSGMSNYEQLSQNIATYSEENPVTEEEKKVLLDFAAEMTSKKTLPCTECKYCITNCPSELDIPNLIKIYNEHISSGGVFIAQKTLDAIPSDKQPSACVGCQSCEQVCPQQIKISEMMKYFVENLR